MRPLAALLAAAPLAGAAAAQIGADCRACHPSEVDGWRASGMSRALEPLRAGEFDGLAAVPAGGGFHYRFEPGEHGARLVEVWTDSAGGRARVEDGAPIAFAIGAGLLDRSYAVRRGDLLRFAPLEVVREREDGRRHAALAPGHGMNPRARWSIPIAEECLRCHTSALPPRDYPYDAAPPPGWEPRGIGCEACHAAAPAHAAWREADLAGRGAHGGDPLARSGGDRVQSGLVSCARCHLQGDAILSIAEPWRGIPGPDDDLFARRAVFVPAAPGTEIGFVSQVDRLAASRCFEASFVRAGRELVCTTCHDPHASVFEPGERARVRDACSGCHAGSEPSAERDPPCALAPAQRGDRACVDCHMRLTGVFDVDAVEIHDHRIERRPPPPSKPGPLRVKGASDGRLVHFTLPGTAPLDARAAPGLHMMALLALGRTGEATQALRAAAKDGPGPFAARIPAFHHLRAGLLEQAGELAEAESALRRALELDPSQAESAVNLGGLLSRAGRHAEAIRVLSGVIDRHPRAMSALRNRAIARYQRNDVDGALADLQAAQAVFPDAAVARLLSQILASRGDRAGAARWEAEARRLEPDAPAPR